MPALSDLASTCSPIGLIVVEQLVMFKTIDENIVINLILYSDIAELENILQQIVQSMIKLGAFQQIRGLKSWILAPKQAEFFQSIDVEFLEAAALQAESK